MSFSGTISNALSGMRLSSLAAELVSSNLANATNGSYAPRSVESSSRVVGGVRLDGVARQVNHALIADWRATNADHARAQTMTTHVSSIESVFSSPDDPTSLTARLADFEASLVAAEARPDLANRLEMVAYRANALTDTFNAMSERIQQTRTSVEKDIGSTVERLNGALTQVADLNSQIARKSVSGQDASALLDLRQKALDDISEIASIRVLARDHETVSIVAKGGAVLLEGTPAEIGFEPRPVVTEHMSHVDGQLGGLAVNGMDIQVSRLGGGKIEALFALRDDVLPSHQQELDVLAENLVQRFQSSTLDPSLSASDAGLFTDGSGAYDPSNLTGLSRRLAVSGKIDVQNGGDLRFLRDGLASASAGAFGDATVLSNMVDVLSEETTLSQGQFAGQPFSLTGHASAVLTSFATQLVQHEDRLTTASASHTALTEDRLRDGVDTDHELQTLMTIEKAYAANAQVLRTVDEMLDVLMGL